MIQEQTTNRGNDLHLGLFIVNTALFAVVWIQLLSSAYSGWSGMSKNAIGFVILFPCPWIVMLGFRRNVGALIVGAFAYMLLADATRMMHL